MNKPTSSQNVSQTFRNSVSALLLSKTLPTALDIYEKISDVLNHHYHRAAYLHQALCEFSLRLLNEDFKLCEATELSFNSTQFGKQGLHECLPPEEFFNLLCKEICDRQEVAFDELFKIFLEELNYVIVFNNVKEQRIKDIMFLFRNLFACLTTFQPHNPCYNFAVRPCTCDTFLAAGDCDCIIEDLS